MTSKRLRGSFFVVQILLLGVVAFAQEQAPTFRATTDVVNVDVSVQDRTRRPMRGLRATDFIVLDNGVRQEISSVSYETLPIDITVALDVSRSVTGNLLARLRRAIDELRIRLSPRDQLKLMTFNNRVRRLLDFGHEREAGNALSGITGAGGTSLYDTLAVALIRPPEIDRRHLVVAFSDAQDGNSISDPAVVIDVARRAWAALDFVLPRAPMAESQSLHRLIASRLAAETGGTVVDVPITGDLSAPFRTLLDDFRSSYVLRFTPRGVEPKGVHQLQVTVNRPGAGIQVRARRSYAWD